MFPLTKDLADPAILIYNLERSISYAWQNNVPTYQRPCGPAILIYNLRGLLASLAKPCQRPCGPGDTDS